MQPMQSENSKVIEMNISNIPNVSEDRTPLMDTAHEVIQPEIFDIPSQSFDAEKFFSVKPPITLQELAFSDISMIPGWMKEVMICDNSLLVHFFSISVPRLVTA